MASSSRWYSWWILASLNRAVASATGSVSLMAASVGGPRPARGIAAPGDGAWSDPITSRGMAEGASLFAAPLRPADGRSGQRVLGPGVPGIAGTQLLAHLRIGAGPEAGQVGRHLLRPVVGGEQVQEHGHPAAR